MFKRADSAQIYNVTYLPAYSAAIPVKLKMPHLLYFQIPSLLVANMLNVSQTLFFQDEVIRLEINYFEEISNLHLLELDEVVYYLDSFLLIIDADDDQNAAKSFWLFITIVKILFHRTNTHDMINKLSCRTLDLS